MRSKRGRVCGIWWRLWALSLNRSKSTGAVGLHDYSNSCGSSMEYKRYSRIFCAGATPDCPIPVFDWLLAGLEPDIMN